MNDIHTPYDMEQYFDDIDKAHHALEQAVHGDTPDEPLTLDYHGERMTLAEWSDELNLRPETIMLQLKRGKSFAAIVDERYADRDYNSDQDTIEPEPETIDDTKAQRGGVPPRLYTYNGETLSISAWARKSWVKISRRGLVDRLDNGWPIEDALMTPLRKWPTYEYDGERKTLRQWSFDRRCSVTYGTLTSRVMNGWSIEDAITRPVVHLRRKRPNNGSNDAKREVYDKIPLFSRIKQTLKRNSIWGVVNNFLR